jgi:MFS family permease
MQSIECRTSWVVTAASLAILTTAFGAPLVAVVALKPIAAGLGVPRSIPALAGAAAYMGSGLGGVVMGWVAERAGQRRLAAFGLVMIALGMAVSAQGSAFALLFGQGVLVGLLGLACLFAPLVTLVSRWFDVRRGTALALVSSGQYTSGVLWPNLFERAVETYGWQATMVGYGLASLVAMLPVVLLLRSAPVPSAGAIARGPQAGAAVLGWPPNLVQVLISAAIFLCCIPMAMPQGHLVAFCSDVGLTPSTGAAMMSVMLGVAFVGRQFWGWLADRVGGLPTLLAGSTVQATALVGFLLTQDEAGLFAVAAVFGMGLSGMVPAYVLAIRELFPDREAAWRVPVLLLAGQGGMAVGSWMAGAIYDSAGAYAPAFAVGVVFNLLNLVLLGVLAARRPPHVGAMHGGSPASPAVR